MIDWLALVVVLPLIGSVATTAVPSRSPFLGIAVGCITTASVLWLGVLITGEGLLRTDLGGWGVPLGISLQADGLSTPLLVMANLVAMGVSIYALGYFSDSQSRHFWPLWLLLWSALNALFLAADLFNLYVTLELLGIAAAALGAMTATQAALAANLRYLLIGLLGSMTYLMGVALLYTGLGTLDLVSAAELMSPGPLAWLAGAFMVGGLLLKAALFPMHSWLPPAHSEAAAPVSAALSALVVKAAVYLVLRLWIDLFGPVAGPEPAYLLGLLGAGGVLWGSWRALRAERLKQLAAYSTVAQVGYLFLFFPLLATAAEPQRQELLGALLLLALTHGFAKASLFLSAGLLQKRAGHDRIDELGTAMRSLPAVAFALGLAGIALIGLPPSGTFIAKWILLAQAYSTGQWWWALVVLAGTLVASGYVFRLLAHAFGSDILDDPRPSGGGETLQATPVGRAMQAPALLLALIACLALGLGAESLWTYLPGPH